MKNRSSMTSCPDMPVPDRKSLLPEKIQQVARQQSLPANLAGTPPERPALKSFSTAVAEADPAERSLRVF